MFIFRFLFFLSFFSSQHWKCLRVEARIWKIIFRYIVFLMDYPTTITAHVNITCVHSMYVDKCTSEATAFCPWKKTTKPVEIPSPIKDILELNVVNYSWITSVNWMGVRMLLHACLHSDRNLMGHMILMDTILPQIDFLPPAWQCTSLNDYNGIIIVTACLYE